MQIAVELPPPLPHPPHRAARLSRHTLHQLPHPQLAGLHQPHQLDLNLRERIFSCCDD